MMMMMMTFISLSLLRELGDVNLGLSLLLRGHCYVEWEEEGFENGSGCGEEEEEKDDEEEDEE